MKINEFRGVKGLVYAEVKKDDENEYATGEVKPLAGVAEISKTTDTSSNVHYYDDIPAVTVESSGKDDITISASAIPLDVLSEITGQFYDEITGTFVECEREEKYFAIGYETGKTDGSSVYVWRHKGTFAIPDENVKTKDNSADAQGQSLKYTGISTIHKFTKTGKPAKAINSDGAKVDKANFFRTAQTIDTVSESATV